ncbi:MAG TPA: beta-ketoacyl-ACP reductase [Nitrospirae bacterium]|nr:beta-ketoacyl-ACP reductase [Nitrospirota bacterium]HDZ87632.1 beta-ketoacyl-ACP reductase [Nitrospirota bacterium]
MSLKDKIALITGAGRGIGEHTAIRFAKEGAKVVINDIDIDHAGRVFETIKKFEGDAKVYQCDVSNKLEVEYMIKAILKDYGGLDILINNASIVRNANANEMHEEQWDEVIDVNLKGSFLCSQMAMQAMITQKWGRIINTSSYIGSFGTTGQANYASSKAGIVGLTKTLALELARYNITVNCVCPGPTETPMNDFLPPQILDFVKTMIPFRRLATPDDIANVHLFLSSEKSNYITGQLLTVDGGLSLGFRGV